VEENGRVTVVVKCRGAVAVKSERVINKFRTVFTVFRATELSVLCNYIAS